GGALWRPRSDREDPVGPRLAPCVGWCALTAFPDSPLVGGDLTDPAATVGRSANSLGWTGAGAAEHGSCAAVWGERVRGKRAAGGRVRSRLAAGLPAGTRVPAAPFGRGQ